MPANQKAEANKDGAPSGLAVGAGFGLSALECRTASDPTMAYVRRREWLSRRENVPSCVFCGEREQMQLTDHIWSELARWKCRTCGHRFFSEPNATDEPRAKRVGSG